MFAVYATFVAFPLLASAQTYSATYLPDTAPKITEQGQTGTNQCGTGSSQSSMCQNVFINSVDDFCIFAPPSPGPDSVIGNTERIEVSWCLKDGHGTRLIPDGAITGAHFVQTPDYVQVTGVGDLTKINVPFGDAGGELDPHGQDGNGNPIGGLVFSSAFGNMQQLHEWTNFVSYNEFCIRGCKDGSKAPALCQHIYDTLGCFWNMPGNYNAGVFEKCKGDTGEPMGVYGTSTFHQGEPITPPAHPAPASSMCTTVASLGDGNVNTTPASPTPSATTVSPSPSMTGSSGVSSASPPSGSSATATRSGIVTTSGTSSVQSAPSGTISVPHQSFSSGLPATLSDSGSGSTTPTGTSSSNGVASTSNMLSRWLKSAFVGVIAGVVAQLAL